MTVVQGSPPGYPGTAFSPYGAPILIPAARPYTVPAGNWLISMGAADYAQVALSGTLTKQFYAAGIAIPFLTSDGANVTIAGGANTTIVPILVPAALQASPPGYAGSSDSPYGVPIAIPAPRPYVIPKGNWMVFEGTGDVVQMAMSGTDLETITVAAVGEAFMVSDGTNVQVNSGSGTTIVPIPSITALQASPAGYPGTGLSTFGPVTAIPATRPYVIPKGTWIVLMGTGDNVFFALSGTQNVQLSVTGIDLTYLLSDGANFTVNGGSGTRLVQVY